MAVGPPSTAGVPAQVAPRADSRPALIRHLGMEEQIAKDQCQLRHRMTVHVTSYII